MKITVLWEDKLTVLARGFGPHDLLVSCVADDLQCAPEALKGTVVPVPKKGNGNVMRALEQELDKLRRSGPVCAVLDRDKAAELWPAGQRPPACLSGLRTAVSERARGDYELVLLIENMETLVDACCRAMMTDMPRAKPSPDTRDRILGKLAWGEADARTIVRNAVPSFDRLVRWVARRMPR